MKTTRKREKDRARGENNIFCTREQDFSLRGLWIYFFFLLPVFFVVTDISPHFPGIKNPFWIIHSILNLAGTCTHNKLNLPRWFWDLSWTCQWQTTKIFSFIFNGNRSGDIESCFWGTETNCPAFAFHARRTCLPHCFAHISCILKILFMSYQLWNGGKTWSHIYPEDTPFHTKTETTQLNPPMTSTKPERGGLLISSWLRRQWGQEIGQ